MGPTSENIQEALGESSYGTVASIPAYRNVCTGGTGFCEGTVELGGVSSLIRGRGRPGTPPERVGTELREGRSKGFFPVSQH